MKIIWIAIVSFVLSVPILISPAHAQETQKADPETLSWQIIDQAIRDKDPEKRQIIVEAASLGGAREKVFIFLNNALDDPELPVRMVACTSLASLNDPKAITYLKKALNDETPEVTFCAAKALWELDDPVGKEILLEVLGEGKATGSSYLTSKKREGMKTFKSKKAFFSTLFRVGIMVAPVPGLGIGISSMQALAKDKNATGRMLAILAFAKGSDPETLQAVRKALNDKEPAVRAAAVHTLALRNDPTVRDDLVPLLEDKKEAVRYRAAVAYLRLTKVAEETKK